MWYPIFQKIPIERLTKCTILVGKESLHLEFFYETCFFTFNVKSLDALVCTFFWKKLILDEKSGNFFLFWKIWYTHFSRKKIMFNSYGEYFQRFLHKCQMIIFQKNSCAHLWLFKILKYAVIFCYKPDWSYCNWQCFLFSALCANQFSKSARMWNIIPSRYLSKLPSFIPMAWPQKYVHGT